MTKVIIEVNKYTTELAPDKRNILVAEGSVTYNGDREVLNNPQEIAQFATDVFKLNNKAEEYLYMIAFDTKMHPIGVFEIGHGTVNATYASPREIFIRALLCGAVCIALVHNHPSGDTTPSKQDESITEDIKKCGDVLSVHLMDHVIVAGSNFESILYEDKGLVSIKGGE